LHSTAIEQSYETNGRRFTCHLKRYWFLFSKKINHENRANSTPWIAIPPKNYEGTENVIYNTHLSSGADLYLFPLLASPGIHHVTTLHSPFPFDSTPGSRLGATDEYYIRWLSAVPMMAISESAKSEAPEELTFVGVVHYGLPIKDYRPTKKNPDIAFSAIIVVRQRR
jgi:hypothetical protein